MKAILKSLVTQKKASAAYSRISDDTYYIVSMGSVFKALSGCDFIQISASAEEVRRDSKYQLIA